VGTSVALNTLGEIVAIGEPFNTAKGKTAGRVRVYNWDDDRIKGGKPSPGWALKGQQLDGEEGDTQGFSVHCTGKGNMITIGAPQFKFSADKDHVLFNAAVEPPLDLDDEEGAEFIDGNGDEDEEKIPVSSSITAQMRDMHRLKTAADVTASDDHHHKLVDGHDHNLPSSGSDAPVVSDASLVEFCKEGRTSEFGGVCCPSSCSQCGGEGCSKDEGGSDNCCLSQIHATKKVCGSASDVKCMIPPSSKPDVPVVDNRRHSSGGDADNKQFSDPRITGNEHGKKYLATVGNGRAQVLGCYHCMFLGDISPSEDNPYVQKKQIK